MTKGGKRRWREGVRWRAEWKWEETVKRTEGEMNATGQGTHTALVVGCWTETILENRRGILSAASHTHTTMKGAVYAVAKSTEVALWL